MKERLIEFLRNENKSSAQLAEEIGVQASGISHIISGRNNPSLDFVLKMLEKYQFLSTEWLLFGKGSMYREAKMQNLFDYSPVSGNDGKELKPEPEYVNTDINRRRTENGNSHEQDIPVNKESSGIVKIVWFYDNNSFEEFYPRK
jgi:transcriptional regulator with XRE-family HTH domain